MTKSVEQLQTQVAAEIVEAQKAIADIEAQGDTSAKGLDAHGRATSRLAILERSQAETTAAILPAKRAEAAAKVERLKADYAAAFANREKIMADCREKIAAWFDYAGGEPVMKLALSQAIPVRDANTRARILQEQLFGAQAHLRGLA